MRKAVEVFSTAYSLDKFGIVSGLKEKLSHFKEQ